MQSIQFLSKVTFLLLLIFAKDIASSKRSIALSGNFLFTIFLVALIFASLYLTTSFMANFLIADMKVSINAKSILPITKIGYSFMVTNLTVKMYF